MRAFMDRHADVIKGVVSGLDRIVFIGRMFFFGVGQRLEGFLGAKGVRFKDFARLALSNRLVYSVTGPNLRHLLGRVMPHP